MGKLNIILIGIIILSGIFNFSMQGQTRFFYPQYALFVFSAGLLGGVILYRKNRWIGFLCALVCVGFLKTFLFQQAPNPNILEMGLFGASIFVLYYLVRELKLKDDVLKFFLIPSVLNSMIIIIQAFDHQFLPIIPVDGITGFLGNKGLSACFIAATIPVFLKYFRRLILLPLVAILLCGSLIAVVMSVVSVLLFFYFADRVKFKILSFIISILMALVLLNLFVLKKDLPILSKQAFFTQAQYRCSMWCGTMDGIKHNPILGWGLGSFEPIMTSIPEKDSIFCGVPFNHRNSKYGATDSLMNHPHNEVLFGWWNFGVLFPILFVGLAIYLVRMFTSEKILALSILSGGLICAMFYFFTPPLWFLMIVSFGIYENKDEIRQK